MSERSVKHHPKPGASKKVRVPAREYPRMVAGFVRLIFLNALGIVLQSGKTKRKAVR